MDIRKVKKLIELLEESAVSEIEIHEGEESVRISRHANNMLQPQQVVVPSALDSMANAQHQNLNQKSSHFSQDSAEEEEAEDLSDSGVVVTAPMVGTFYSASAPGEQPFVQMSSSVASGDVLCIIEAMKMLNQIEAETTGKIKKILVENGQPVEFGQPLFVIEEA